MIDDSTNEAVNAVRNFFQNEGINNEATTIKTTERKSEKTTQRESSEERVLTEFEQEQASRGWNPKGKKSAEEWARSEPLYEEIKQRGKQIKNLQRTVDELKQFMSRQEEQAYKRALAELSAQRNQAIRNGDVELVNEIEKQSAELNPQKNTAAVEPDVVSDFKQRHADWLESTDFEHMQMSDWLYKHDVELGKRGLPPEQHMKLLEEHLIKQFPGHFKKDTLQEDEEYTNINSVERSSYESDTKASSKKKFSFQDLNNYQKQVARDFERLGVMKIDEYIKQLQKMGDLK